MNSAKYKQKQLNEQHLQNLVSENRKTENYQRDLWKIEANSVDRALSRAKLRQRHDLDVEHALQQRAERERKQQEEYEKQKQMAQELQETQRKKFVEEKLRQQIRESNHELKELESKLKAAYVRKGLTAQLREKEALALQERLNLQNEMAALEQARLSYEELLRKEREKEQERKKKFREDLNQQIISSSLKNQHLYEDFLKEKRYLDEIIKRIQDEHMEEIRLKMIRKERTKQEMEEFRKAQLALKEKQRIEMEEENQRILMYCLERERKRLEEEAAKQTLNAKRDQLQEKMVAQLAEMMEEAKKRETLLQELYEIEKNEREDEKLRKDLEEKIRLRIEARISLAMQRANNQLKKDQEAAEEREFYEKQMEMLAERDKLEQLSNEKRRRKQLEHKQAIRELIENRRVERAQRMAEMVKETEAEIIEEQERQKLVEEERIKLLKEHAKSLIGFLPVGILKELQNS